MIEHQIQKLLKYGYPVIIVLGSDSDLIAPVVEKYAVTTVINHAWAKEMGGSIAAGALTLLSMSPQPEGVMITLMDQPLVPPEHYTKMLDAFQPGLQSIIISSSTTGLEGVPVLFDQCYLDELKGLKGDQGARKVV